MLNLSTLFFIAAFVVGNIYKISFFSDSLRLSLLDISVCIVLLLNVKYIFTSIFTHPVTKSVSIFSVIALFSLFISGHAYGSTAMLVGLAYLFRFWAYSSLLLVPNLPSLSKVGWVLVLSGLFQYFFIPKINFLIPLGWDPHYYRVVGSLLDPGFTGLMLVFLLIYFYYRNKPLSWFITFITMALTYSRSSYLAYLIAMGAVSWHRKSVRLLLLTWILLAITLPLLPKPTGEGVRLERTNSILARLINWKNSLTIFIDHPILGVGFNTYRYAQNEYGFLGSNDWVTTHAGAGADSSLLFVAATTGVVGLFFYGSYIKSYWRFSKSDPILRASLLALFFHSLFLNSQFYPFVLVWLALLVSKDSSLLSSRVG